MQIFYDLILLIFALIYLPFAVFKGKFRRDFILRLRFLPKNVIFNRPIWLHAVSVGEVLSSQPLLDRIRNAYPDKQIVISTITATGNKTASSIAKEKDFVFYLPLDLSFIINKVIKRINPAICIIMETEIWPNFICGLNQEGVPIIVANARISDKSYGKYRALRFLFKPILSKVNVFCAQTQTDGQRLISLGVEKNKVKITGNMKFDFMITQIKKTDYTDLLNLGQDDKLWVCGSTHPGEEEIILDVYAKIIKDFSNLKLLLAPRHPERAQQVAELVKKKNFIPVFISKPQTLNPNSQNIFLLDTVGQLTSLYSLADIVFVGGSLVKIGGHNVIEPAYFKKAVISGPYTHNFRDIMDCFLSKDSLIVAKSVQELEKNLRLLLKNDSASLALGERAYQVIKEQQGAADRVLEEMKLHGLKPVVYRS